MFGAVTWADTRRSKYISQNNKTEHIEDDYKENKKEWSKK